MGTKSASYDFGDYHDNEAAFRSGRWKIHHGLIEEGLELFRQLRSHIELTGDTKSLRYLIPNIDYYERYVSEFGGGHSSAENSR